MGRAPLGPLARIGLLVVALVVLGEIGHQVFARLHWEAGHHAFHALYGAGAVALFVGYAIGDVRRHGLPRFSWSLRPDPDDDLQPARR